MTALLLHLLQNRVPAESAAWIVLIRTSPPTFWFAASACLGYSMILIGKASGARFVGRNALAFVLMLILATALHAFTDLRGRNAIPTLVPELEWLRVAAIFRGVIQLIFLLLLIREVKRAQ